jgi:hypothetical protein
MVAKVAVLVFAVVDEELHVSRQASRLKKHA